MKILAVIPARGGSKGIPNKNLAPLNGLPLLAYTIRAAQRSSCISALVVSTDSSAICGAAQKLGATVVMRPAELATDTAPTAPVVTHALKQMEAVHGLFEAVMLLQPTAPLRIAADIDAAASSLASNPAADSLVSCYDGTATHPRIMYHLRGDYLVPLQQTTPGQRRQDFEPVFVRNGAIYLVRRELIASAGRLIGDRPLALIMPKARSVNIDEPEDLLMAEFWLRRQPTE